MKDFLRKLFGFEEMDRAIEETRAASKAAQQPPVMELSPKEQATENKEPWVGVLNTHVNKDNIRNGFFELDWNEYFVLELRTAGYRGESDEEIVNQWFTELCRNVAAEDGIDMSRRGTGYINVNNLGNGRSEVS
ncbi:MAG: hypothetical protein EBU90_04685 [Proteobacteria bacterium]|nr:hypothetical protein [Pseudomonadota bacterium]NBP13737.1 hypothetical protein [bacterium]